MQKTILIFGSICVSIFLLLQLAQWSLFAIGGSENLYQLITAALFLSLGALIGRYLWIETEARKQKRGKSSLSNQELQVLQLVADGHSNKEIGELLFIAETTVKSHVSNILMKLGAKRRTEAVRIGRDLEII